MSLGLLDRLKGFLPDCFRRSTGSHDIVSDCWKMRAVDPSKGESVILVDMGHLLPLLQGVPLYDPTRSSTNRAP